MNTRLKTKANTERAYGLIPGDLPMKNESCFMPLDVSETMDCFASKNQGYGAATYPLGMVVFAIGAVS